MRNELNPGKFTGAERSESAGGLRSFLNAVQSKRLQQGKDG